MAAIISPKRKAIADSSKTMFLWVAAMSAIVGVCVVVGIFLVQQIMFKAAVVGKMSETVDTLRQNNKVAVELTQNVVALESNAALNAAKANPDQKALQVILDALPADRNTLALGSSLQQSLLADIDGLTLESLSVDSGSATSPSDDASGKGIGMIPIQFQVSSSSADSIKAMLTKLERSIRVIDIDSLVLERSDTSYQVTVSAHAYYQGER